MLSQCFQFKEDLLSLHPSIYPTIHQVTLIFFKVIIIQNSGLFAPIYKLQENRVALAEGTVRRSPAMGLALLSHTLVHMGTQASADQHPRRHRGAQEENELPGDEVMWV